jgi:membrane-associated phospholipid phosphatase
MFSQIHAFDLTGLHLLNVDWASPELDQFWLTISHLDRELWFKFGVLPALLVWLFYIYRWGAIKPLLAVGLAVGITDVFSAQVIKKKIDRPRPFMNAEVSSWIRKVDDAHAASFPSNHAANCFAGATVLAWYWRRRRYYFYTFALLVALSRPALGVHYPTDIIGGALLGICVALLVRSFVLNQILWFHLPAIVSKESVDSVDWRTRTERSFHD